MFLILAACNSIPQRGQTSSVQPTSPPQGKLDLPSDDLPSVSIGPTAPDAEAIPAIESELQLDSGQFVFFETASAALTAEAREKIRGYARKLKIDRQHNLILEGRTDDLGSKEMCIAIATKRIEAVKNELVGQGVKLNQIQKHARGCETFNERLCSTESCRLLRRSVELKLVEKS